jgi:A/G-specific adenine glycosylase
MDFSQKIIPWYNKNKRDLPWRHTKDPYKIWLSEIIMQQTRVQQGLPYYIKFAKKFPTVHHLAKASEEVVMKAWQGLGYYSRARNLHHTAKFISKELKGKFPVEFEAIKKLKGVGEYTASAIASFAFDKPYAVVDGNVFRVLSRYLGIETPIDSSQGKKLFTEKATVLLDKKDPGTFNQAIMEFGAMQCVPQNPDCKKCPLNKSCKAFAQNLVERLPVKSQKTKIRTRYFNYLVIRKNNLTLIKKRIGNDIWKNMYDFPIIETKKEMKKLRNLEAVSVTKSLKHILSHQVIFAKFWELNKTAHKKYTGIYVSENQLSKYPFPRLMEIYFEKNLQKIN